MRTRLDRRPHTFTIKKWIHRGVGRKNADNKLLTDPILWIWQNFFFLLVHFNFLPPHIFLEVASARVSKKNVASRADERANKIDNSIFHPLLLCTSKNGENDYIANSYIRNRFVLAIGGHLPSGNSEQKFKSISTKRRARANVTTLIKSHGKMQYKSEKLICGWSASRAGRSRSLYVVTRTSSIEKSIS